MRSLLRLLFLRLVRLYFPEMVVRGREHLGGLRAAIFVLNHPNALLDPVVLQVALGRPVRFLAKSTLFGNFAGRLVMGAFAAIPVYRQQDGAADGQADKSARNERTFVLCREALSRGESLALFPEGTSHAEPRLRPFKSGAARIALSAEKEHGGGLGLVVVPVGLDYPERSVFRSRVLLNVGLPIAVRDFYQRYLADEREAVQGLTQAIQKGLEDVVLQAETRELIEGVARVARWTAGPGERDDPEGLHRRQKELLDAYRALGARDPERLGAIVQSARDYARGLGELGVSDPWALEAESAVTISGWAALRMGMHLGLLLPFALLGALLSWAPYRLAGVVARRMTDEEDMLGTLKLLGGMLFLLVAWLLEAIVAGTLAGGFAWGALCFLAAPLCSYAALRFSEKQGTALLLWRHVRLRRMDPGAVERLVQHRRQLATEVASALRAVACGDGGEATMLDSWRP